MKTITTVLAAWLCLPLAAATAAEYEGEVQWERRAVLGTTESGRVEEVLVGVGERVLKGQLLARLDERAAQARHAAAGAELAAGGIRRQESLRELERTRDLFDRALLSAHDLEVVRIEAKKAEAVYQSMNSKLVEARTALEYSRITAPFDGVIVERLVQPGEFVVNRERVAPWLVIAAERPLRARLLLTPAQARSLTPGGTATVRSGGRSMQGTIAGVSPEPAGRDGGRPLYAIDVRFDPPPGGLLAGERVRVELP